MWQRYQGLTSLVPFQVLVISMASPKEPELANEALEVYNLLAESSALEGEVVLDDRHESPGFKMKEAQLLGFPWMVVVGKAMKNEGKVEIENRKTKQQVFLGKNDVLPFLLEQQQKATTMPVQHWIDHLKGLLKIKFMQD